MAGFSTLLRARIRARRTCCYRAETPLKLMFRAHQSRRATRRGKRKMAQNSLREPFGKLVCQCRAKNPFRTLSERLLGRLWGGTGLFWTAPGHSWPAWGVPRSALGRRLGVQKPSRTRPEASPKRFWTPRTAQGRLFVDFGTIWREFPTISDQFFVDFRSNRLRGSHKIGDSKKSRDPRCPT